MKTVFTIEKLVRNGINIIDVNGNIFTFEHLNEIYNLKETFLDYQRLIKKISRAWKETINEHTINCKDIKYNVQINCYIKFILKDKKGSRAIYDKIVSVTQMQRTNRWNRELGDIINDELKTYNLKLKYINEIQLRDFRFKFNNKILVTNAFLYIPDKKRNAYSTVCKIITN